MKWKRTNSDEEKDRNLTFFTNVRFVIPRTYLEKLAKLAEVRGYTVSHLIAIAVHNEFEVENPFEFNTDWPEEPYVPLKYAGEAERLYNFLMIFERKGLTLENIILTRESYGVYDADTVRLALRELYINEKVEAFTPIYKARTPNEGEKFRVKTDWNKVKQSLKKLKGPLDDA